MELMTTMLSDFNTTEDTGFQAPDSLVLLYNILVILQVSVLMLSMGCGTELKEIKHYITHPKGPIVGVVCQLILMPFMTFAFAQALRLEADLAIGMVLVSSCPGGAPANFFTLISRGNLALSVCLTVFSTVLALGTMPLNKTIYIGSWIDELPVIPYANIVIAIVTTWVPACIGIAINYKFPKVGAKLTRIFGVSAFFILIAFAFVQQFVYPGVFQLPWGVWFAAILLPVFGWILGFGVATMFLFKIPERRAIAYSTSYVNGGLTLALITLSFGKSPKTNEYIMFPMLYTASQLVMAIVIGVSHIFFFRMKEGKTICQKLYRKYHREEEKNTGQELSLEDVKVDDETSKVKSNLDENSNVLKSKDSSKVEKNNRKVNQDPPPYNSFQFPGESNQTESNVDENPVNLHI